jgi:hypothetical protein
MMTLSELTYRLSLNQAQIVMDALAELPWRVSNPVILSMRAQADVQFAETEKPAQEEEKPAEE